MAPQSFPPAIPKSDSRASPGPLTAQPRTEMRMGCFMCEVAFWTFWTSAGRSISQRAQVGQEIMSTPCG